MSLNNKQSTATKLRNLFLNIRIRTGLSMLFGAIVIFMVFHMVSTQSTILIRDTARHMYSNELKIIITDQYIDSMYPLRPAEKEYLEYKYSILVDKGSLYAFIAEATTDIGKRAVKEFDHLYQLADRAKALEGNTVELLKIYHESIATPSREVYDDSLFGIVRNVTTSTTNTRIMIAALFGVFLALYFMMRVIAVRIGYITDMARSLINTDDSVQLTKRLTFKSTDEMKDVVSTMNSFMEHLENHVVTLSSGGMGMDIQMNEMYSASAGWKLETQVMHHSTERISKQMSHQITSVNQAAAALEQMERTLDIIFNNISRQSAAMTQSAATLEEMGRQVEGVAKISSDTEELAKKLTTVASKGHSAVEISIVSIRDVAEYSSQIIKLLSLITGIAKQTNLLAMNASIEAAHAGEAGRGFAIVAEEIRRLSETTNKNAKEIRTVVDTMVEKIDNSVGQVQIAGEELIQITNYVSNVEDSIAQLNGMMQEQNTATHEMIMTIEGLVTLAQESKISMEEQQHGLREYSTTINDLKENFNEVKSTLDGHMSSVSNLLVILTDMGVRIDISHAIMQDVGAAIEQLHINEELLPNPTDIAAQQNQQFIEIKSTQKIG